MWAVIKNPGWSGYTGDEQLRNYIGIMRRILRIPMNHPGSHGDVMSGFFHHCSMWILGKFTKHHPEQLQGSRLTIHDFRKGHVRVLIAQKDAHKMVVNGLMATIPMVESVKNHQLPLRKLTWNLKILPWKRRNYKSLIFGLYVNPGSQPPFKTWWFPLDDDKPFLKKWWFVNQPIKNGGQGLPGFNFEGVNTSRSRGTF